MESSDMLLGTVLAAARARVGPVDADMLVGHVLGRSPAWLFAHEDARVGTTHARAIEALVHRRQAGEPVAYLVGRRGFWTLDLEVTADTLIPRPETELLVELALARLPGPGGRCADLGTGSGAIALSIASERPDARIIATDASHAALAVAQRNAAAHAVTNVEFRHGDWYDAVAGASFDLIASNPPYIAEGDPHLERGDLRHEPPAALASGSDGLDAIRHIVRGAPLHLVPGGWLLLEHGAGQGAAVRDALEGAGFSGVETARDLESRDRVSLGRLPGTG